MPTLKPLKNDPSRTGGLRKIFSRKIQARFNRLKREVTSLLVGEDVFGLLPGNRVVSFLNQEASTAIAAMELEHSVVANTRWRFRSTEQQKMLFDQWLRTQINTTVLPTDPLDQYWETYIQQAYDKGQGRAFDDLRKGRKAATAGDKLDFFEGTRAEFLRQSFNHPPSVEKVKLLASRVFTDLQGVTEATSAQLSRTLVDGLIQGRNPRDIARTMKNAIEGIGKNRADLIARTECLTGETLVDAAMVRAVFRRGYAGDIVEIETASGGVFSTTPNHPMLTQEGWVPAGLLNQSHQLISHNREQGSRVSRNPDVVGSPIPIRQIFDSLNTVGILERVCAGKPDFHGDGMDGDVEILRPDRELRIGSFSPLNQPILNDVLSPSGKSSTRFCSDCRCLLPVDKTVCLLCGSESLTLFDQPAFNGRSIFSEIFRDLADRLAGLVIGNDLVNRQVLPVLVGFPSQFPRQQLRGRDTARDSSLSQDLSNLFLIGANFLSDFSLSHPRQVEFDNVVSLRVRPFSGHVYNLQTKHGYFNIDNGYYTGNTIRAHAEGQLDAFERLGVTELGVMSEWETAGDQRVCPLCFPLEGIVLTVREARGMIPRHPRCRCIFLPAQVGEPKRGQGQKRGKAKVDRQIRESVKAEIPKKSKRSIAAQRKQSLWVGADKDIAKQRPKSILDTTKTVTNRKISKKAPKKPIPPSLKNKGENDADTKDD